MTEWADELRKQGLMPAGKVTELASRYEKPDNNPRNYPFPIREDTGMRDLRVKTS
jgi:hypothetical protein